MSDYQALPLIDRETFDDLADVMEEEMGELVEAFLEDCPDLLKRIADGVNGNDADMIVRAAHSLKSSAANLGAMRLSAVSRDLEEAGRKNDLQTCTSLNAVMASLWAESARSVKDALAQAGN